MVFLFYFENPNPQSQTPNPLFHILLQTKTPYTPNMPKPYTPNDKWSQRAAAEGYRARSVYKLMELDERLKLLKPGMHVLDLGAAPGSWMQYTSQIIGPKGKIVGCDLTPIEPIADNVKLYQQDITDEAAMTKILEDEGMREVDLVLSDIAPNTSGIKDVDQYRSVELAITVFHIADRYLKKGGRCVVKVFRGADFDELVQEVKRMWGGMRVMTVEATRDRSREVYVTARKS
jgi:23S rRNA (uridine2552-2'-O)-methyltransferase